MHPPVDVVIAAAGSGVRLGADCPKAFVEVGGVPLLARALDAAAAVDARRTVVAVPAELPEPWIERVEELAAGRTVVAVAGGSTRQASVCRGLEALRDCAAADGQPEPGIVLVHDAARPCASPDLWRRVIDSALEVGAAIPVLPSVDSLKEVDGEGAVVRSVDRSRVVRVQTPQGFRFDWLMEAHLAEAVDAEPATDDAALLERAGRPIAAVPGEPTNLKVTTDEDLLSVGRLLGARPPAATVRVGYGYDIHPLVEGRRLVLGGVEIEHDLGLQGHSDADSLSHAITDALLGAAGLGDIGLKFPADDPRWKDADSLELLSAVVADLEEAGFRPLNVDATILAERPRLAPHLDAMRERLALCLDLRPGEVNVKATRGEGIGSIGRGEGIAAHAVVTVGPV